MNLKKELGSVADAVSKVMEAELSPKQKAIAKLDEPKHKIDAGDLAKLRAGHKPVKEAQEQIDEYKSVGGVYKHKGTYGTEKSTEAGYTDYDKENEMAKKNLKAKEPKKYGARQNYVRSTRVNESFSSMLEAYKQNGLSVFVKEEPDNEQYHKEVDDQIATATGKKKQPKLSTGETLGVKSMAEETHTEVEVYDFTDVNGVKVSTIDLEEKSLTEPEMKKKEEVVKSMKKKMPGFKERYGERAKSVMYATATKIAKEKA